MSPEEINKGLAEILSLIYLAIPFKKFKAIKSIHDVFNHRVRSASRKQNLEQFVSKLCNYFGIQSLPNEVVDIVNVLKPVEEQALKQIYLEHIYICALCYLRVEEKRKNKKQKESLYEN
ncbi:MAG TPA: hypothetical protein PLK41_07965 [Defluviitoga tunisiensis]|nr:hypothetical protein [Defluviitoga tunisiensis]HPP10908.1 hypothetical protein [Defluviitoga tunisiensis]